VTDKNLDLEAARKLVDDLTRQLAEAGKGGAKIEELRAEVKSLHEILNKPETEHSWIADRLTAIEDVFEHAAVELLADGIKAGQYLAEIGRILGVR
jgi:predicted nuclease with TOPRIM domain